MASKSIALHGAGGGGSGGAPPPNLTRAALELYEAKPIASGSEPGAPIDRIPFQFNPKELSISKSASWARSNARDAKAAGTPQFNGADPCKMTFELFFDATDTMDGSVVARVEQLFACCVPTDDSLGKKKWAVIHSTDAFGTSGAKALNEQHIHPSSLRLDFYPRGRLFRK